MKLKTTLLIGAVIVLVIFIWDAVQRHRHLNNLTNTVTLKDNENAKVIIDTEKREIVSVHRKPGTRSNAKTSLTLYDGIRKAVISVDKDGSISVTAPERGWIFEPGHAYCYDGEFRIALDVQLYYLRRWGLSSGIGYAPKGQEKITAYLAATHQIPLRHFENTSLLAGIDLRRRLIVGVRMKF